MNKKFWLWLVLILGLFAFIGGGVVAQDSTLTYDAQRLGELSDSQPVSFFTFSGQSGDLIVARVVAFNPDMIPTISLNAPSGRQVVFVEGGADAPSMKDAYLGYQLMEDGQYTLQIGTAPGTPRGQFLLTFTGYLAQDFTEIGSEGLTVAIEPDDPVKLYRFAGQESSPLTLTIYGSEFTAEVYDASGNFASALKSSPVLSASLTMDGGEGMYSLLVFSTSESGQFTIAFDDEVSDHTPPPPVSTEEVGAPPNGCVATGSGVNVRSGPGTDFEAIASLNGSSQVIGVAPGGWYQIALANGFVFGNVVNLSGDCNNLPSVGGPPSQATPTYTHTPDGTVTVTATETPPSDATATVTDTPPADATATNTPPSDATATNTSSPTATFTPSYTPTEAPPTAPPDANPHNWAIDRENGGTFSQVVSGPDGDVSDRVDASVNLLQSPPNNSRTVDHTLSCSGTGTENIRWTRQSPNAQQYTCGQTITWRYAHPNSSMSFYVFYLDGSPTTYVNYTITAVVTGD